jgi:predicted transcriptional regulator
MVQMTYHELAVARWYLRSYLVKQRIFEYIERSKWTYNDST